MPQPRRQKLEPDRLVEALVPDPATGPPDAVVLRGFLGRSPEDGVWRLYVTAALDEYVDIPESEILHSQKLPDDGGTVIWVPRTLELHYARVQAQRVQAEFLGGAVTGAAAAGAAGAAAAAGGQPIPPPSIGIACPSVVVVCQTNTIPCQSDFVACQSDFAPCNSFTFPCQSRTFPCQSRTVPCQSDFLIGCPTRLLPCTSIYTVHCPPSVATPCVSRTVLCPSVNTPCQSITIPCTSGIVCHLDPLDPGPIKPVG